jgi:hypothetical protein
MTRRFQFGLLASLAAIAVNFTIVAAVAFWAAADRNATENIDPFAHPLQEGDKIIPVGEPPKSIFRELQEAPLADDHEKPGMAHREKWPFADPPNMATITVRQILKDGEPILYVTHDADDGGWQFLTGGDVSESDAMVVSLEEMLEHDPTLAELANLEPGWTAARGDVGMPWHRSRR